MPEPELVLLISPKGRILGYTAGNDMSSRDIEGENPLYLPQAKVYDGSCAIGPTFVVNADPIPPDTRIDLEIRRGAGTEFTGSTSVSEMKRDFPTLVEYLYRETELPERVPALHRDGRRSAGRVYAPARRRDFRDGRVGGYTPQHGGVKSESARCAHRSAPRASSVLSTFQTMKKSLTFTGLVLAAGLWLAAVLTAMQPAPPRQNQAARIDYQRQVQPIIEKHCLECHSQDKRKGGLSLATYADALDGGRNGPVDPAGQQRAAA